MRKEVYEIKHPVDAVPYQKFAELIGKEVSAVKTMVDNNKLPMIPWQNPANPTPKRAENWVYIPEFNRAMKDAYYSRPKELRDAWLLWIGL